MVKLEDKPQRVSGIQGMRLTELLKYWMYPKYNQGRNRIKVAAHHWGPFSFLPSKTRCGAEDHPHPHRPPSPEAD